MTGVVYQGWEAQEKMHAVERAIYWIKKGCTSLQVQEITGLSQQGVWGVAKKNGLTITPEVEVTTRYRINGYSGGDDEGEGR